MSQSPDYNEPLKDTAVAAVELSVEHGFQGERSWIQTSVQSHLAHPHGRKRKQTIKVVF